MYYAKSALHYEQGVLVQRLIGLALRTGVLAQRLIYLAMRMGVLARYVV